MLSSHLSLCRPISGILRCFLRKFCTYIELLKTANDGLNTVTYFKISFLTLKRICLILPWSEFFIITSPWSSVLLEKFISRTASQESTHLLWKQKFIVVFLAQMNQINSLQTYLRIVHLISSNLSQRFLAEIYNNPEDSHLYIHHV